MIELRTKLYDKLILESKKFWFHDHVITFCDNFWDTFPLGITCNRKLWPKVISNYLWITRKYKSYSLIIAKVLHNCNFVKNTVYHGGPPCSFPNFYEFLENFGAGTGYGALRLWAIIVTYFHFYIFKYALVLNLEIW